MVGVSLRVPSFSGDLRFVISYIFSIPGSKL